MVTNEKNFSPPVLTNIYNTIDRGYDDGSFRLMTPGHYHFDAIVGNAVVEVKNDSNAAYRKMTSKFTGCEKNLRCFAVCGRRITTTEIKWGPRLAPDCIFTVEKDEAETEEHALVGVLRRLIGAATHPPQEQKEVPGYVIELDCLCTNIEMFPGENISLEFIPEWVCDYVGRLVDLYAPRLGGDR